MYFSRIKLRPEILKSSQLNRVLENNVYGAHRLLWSLFSEKTRNHIYREEIAREQLGSSSNVRGESIYYMVSQSKPIEPEHSLFKVETKNYQPRLIVGQILSFECRVNPVITKKTVREDIDKYLLERAKRQVKDVNKITSKRIRHDIVMNAQLGFLKKLVKELNLEGELPANAKKPDFKKCLLAKGSEALKQRLIEILAANMRYAERLQQVSTLASLLEWAIKAQVDIVLENWWKTQGERCGFELVFDKSGLCKLQNSSYQWHALPEKGKHAGFSSIDFAGHLQITDAEKFKASLFKGIGRSKAFGCGLLMIKRV